MARFTGNKKAPSQVRWFDAFNADLTDLNGRVVILNEAIFGTYRIMFNEGTSTSSGRYFGFIFYSGEGGTRHLSLFFNAYGYGDERVRISELTKGSVASYEVEDENTAIDVIINLSSGSSRDILGVFMLYGKAPTIEKISG